jgi:hypothetical protein
MTRPPCGPHTDQPCPTCGMDAAEIAYAERIIALGGAEVYRQEFRKTQAAKGRPA